MLLCTVVSNYKSAQVDFLPLTVDYREKFAAAGRYPGGFFKREARQSDGEVLTMRLVDRVLRPLFPKDYHNEVQVMIQLMSHDENVMQDALVGLAASAAISLSDIPFKGTIASVRVGRIDDKLVMNPTKEQMENSDFDLVLSGSEDSIVMVEGKCEFVSEEDILTAIQYGHEGIKELVKFQKDILTEMNITKRDLVIKDDNIELQKAVDKLVAHGAEIGAMANGFVTTEPLKGNTTVDVLESRLELTPQKYVTFTKDWLSKGAKIIGCLHMTIQTCLLYTSPSPRDYGESRMPSSA